MGIGGGSLKTGKSEILTSLQRMKCSVKQPIDSRYAFDAAHFSYFW